MKLNQVETHHHLVVDVEAFDFGDILELLDKLVANLDLLGSSTVPLEIIVDLDE